MKTKTHETDWGKLDRTVTFNFGREGGLVPPPNLNELGIGEEVTLTVVGKVAGFSADEEGECLRVEVKKVAAEPQGQKRTLGSMLRELKKAKEEEE